MVSQPEFGSRLATLRRQRGISQSDLAGGELSTSYVSLLEAGKRMPQRRVLERLAERLGCAVDYLETGVDPGDRQQLVLELRYAELARRSGELDAALERFEALAAGVAVEAAGLRDDVLVGLAHTLEATGRIEDAIKLYDEVRTRAEDDPRAAHWWPAVIGLARCHREVGDIGYSIDIGEQARRRLAADGLLATDLGVQLVATLVAAYYERGDLARARLLIDEAGHAAELLDSRVARGAAYWNASVVANEQGRRGEAMLLAERALAMYAEGDDACGQAALLQFNGWLLLRQDPPRPQEALALLDRASALLEQAGAGSLLAHCDTESARAQLLLGEVDDAATRAMRALGRLRGGGALEAARARVVLAAVHFASGSEHAALQAYESAAENLRASGATRQAAGAWLELADVLEGQGRDTEALVAYRQAATCAGLRSAAAPVRPVCPAPGPVLGPVPGPGSDGSGGHGQPEALPAAVGQSAARGTADAAPRSHAPSGPR